MPGAFAEPFHNPFPAARGVLVRFAGEAVAGKFVANNSPRMSCACIFQRIVQELLANKEQTMKTVNLALVPVPAQETRKSSRHPLRGLPYWESDDFDAPMPELTAMVADSGPD